jgi:SAM-dependent methyltransferase
MSGSPARAGPPEGSAAIERHLKQAQPKVGDHSMRNIDCVYMINLDARPEKYALARRYLEVHGITPYRFSAVNGWELSKRAIDEVGLRFRPGMTPLLATRYPSEVEAMVPSHEFMAEYGKTYFMHCMPLGAIGCVLSHLSVLRDAWDCGYETVWVMEDDIEVLSDHNVLSDLLGELDALVGSAGWDVLFTDVDYRAPTGEYLRASGAAKRPDCDCSPEGRFIPAYTQSEPLNANFRTVAARFGSTSMVLRRSAIAKLLDFYTASGIYGPYDLDNLLPGGIRRYGLTFDLVTNMLHSISDVGAHGFHSDAPTIGSFLCRYSEPVYQDLLVAGESYRVGTDLCESRYELIKPVLDLADGAFSVLDLGAAQGYFSFRIAREYPESACVMAEADDTSYYAHHGAMLRELRLMNGDLPNVVHLDKRLDEEDLTYLAGAEHFDVVLALLVVHLMEDSLREQVRVLEVLLGLGEHVIVEVATEVGVVLTAYVEYLAHALDAQFLGEVKRHKNPGSTATGRLFCFTSRDGGAAASRCAGAPLGVAAATLGRLNGAPGADLGPRRDPRAEAGP